MKFFNTEIKTLYLIIAHKARIVKNKPWEIMTDPYAEFAEEI